MVVGVVVGGGGPTYYRPLTFHKLVQELPGENMREDPELENFERAAIH